jgi:hypothetical protein
VAEWNVSPELYSSGEVAYAHWDDGSSDWFEQLNFIEETKTNLISTSDVGIIQIRGIDKNAFSGKTTIEGWIRNDEFSLPIGTLLSEDYDLLDWTTTMDSRVSSLPSWFYADAEIIDGYNDTISFLERQGGVTTSEITANIASGKYSSYESLKEAIETAMNTASATSGYGLSYTWDRPESSYLWNVSPDTDEFQFYWLFASVNTTRLFGQTVVGANIISNSGMNSSNELLHKCLYPAFSENLNMDF